jgi:hypothetical protein
MTYPPAPWSLQGFGLVSLNLIDSAQVRSLIPNEISVIDVWPGKTLGGVYLAFYGSGSVLEYNELIVFAPLVRYSNQFGSWITHIYVDHPDSVAGGREIWGLPKELAEFTWEQGKQPHVVVRQSDRILCALNYNQPLLLWQQQASANTFSTLHSHLLRFQGKAKFQVGITSGSLEVQPESSFHQLNLSQPLLMVYLKDLNLLADRPEIMG